MANDPNVPDHAAEPSSNPFTTPAAQQIKALLGLFLVALTAVAVSFPDSVLLKTIIGVIGAVVTYAGVYSASNAKT